jgi:Protein of unknown function (DUF3551)
LATPSLLTGSGIRLEVLTALPAVTVPAAGRSATSYPWCMKGRGDTSCCFRSYLECRATLSGLGGWCMRSLYHRVRIAHRLVTTPRPAGLAGGPVDRQRKSADRGRFQTTPNVFIAAGRSASGAGAQPSARCRTMAMSRSTWLMHIGASQLGKPERDPFTARDLLARLHPRRPHHLGVAPHAFENTIPGRSIPFADAHLLHHPAACWARRQMND